VTLNVTDDDGATDTVTKPVVVTDNQQPTANFTYSPTGPLTNETVEFDPSASSDPDGTIVEYRWDLDGDGTDDTVTTSATNVTWNYADDGDFNVTLEVVDNDSATDTESKTVAVQNRPPMANFTHSPTRPVTGEAVTFDATNSTDPDGTVDYYAWDFDGDGTVDQNTTSATIEHTYDSSGEQNVSLTVTDDDGARNTTNTTVQVVGGRPHVAYVDPGTQDGRTIDRGGRISQFDMTGAAEAIGPPTTDFDGDGLVEVPYVTSSNNLKVVDRNGERTQLRTGDVRGSGLTVGRFGTDEPAIYWANVNDDTTVYRTYYNGTTETIGSFGNSVKAVGGIGDVDDDGADELVVVVGGPTLAYVDDDGNTLKAQSDFIGSNNNWGIGRVADYDGDGAERVAVVDGSNNVLLVSCSKKDANMADCTTTDVASGTAAKTVLGAFDWNDDGEAEVMFADTSDPAKLSYANVTGSGTGAGADVTTVRDENDDTVSVYVEGGVASIHRARPVRRPASG
jgi:PKD repeat protein